MKKNVYLEPVVGLLATDSADLLTISGIEEPKCDLGKDIFEIG